MRNPLLLKIFLVLLVTMVLAAGLSQIDYLVRERTQRRDMVVADIAAATAGDQTLIGPVLVVPFTRIVKTQKPSEKEEGKFIEVEKRFSGNHYLLPTELNLQTNLNSEQIQRSLYQLKISICFIGEIGIYLHAFCFTIRLLKAINGLIIIMMISNKGENSNKFLSPSLFMLFFMTIIWVINRKNITPATISQ